MLLHGLDRAGLGVCVVNDQGFLALGVAPSLVTAMEARGFTAPTPVQTALLDPALGKRDLLVSSQTGSGKTVAFGLLLAGSAPSGEAVATPPGACAPRALVVTPTRELAVQVRTELAWLVAPIGCRVLAVTGGTSVGGELRALAAGADVLVGTPGRLCDHLSRGAVNTQRITTVVLDEADEMLDMGFREELETILQALPTERRTVMLSATLPSEIVALAKRYQSHAARVAIDPPGAANRDIAHVAHLVPDAQRVDALVNILLAAPDERTLVFVRTRIEASNVAATLEGLGFTAAALTGEMVQRDRTLTLDAFRAGRVTTLIATDVAARGLDVPEVSRVIHLDLPGDAASLTHRSGRTGRAGRKGTSVMIVAPSHKRRAITLLRATGVHARWDRAPDAKEIQSGAEIRLRTKLTGAPTEPSAVDGKHRALAAALLAETNPTELVARLLGEVPWEGPCPARTVTTLSTEVAERWERPNDTRRDFRGAPRASGAPGALGAGPRWVPESRGFAPRANSPKDSRLEMFKVNFGAEHGATASRLLAMVCRRGGVRGADVGAIAIGAQGSTFGVSTVCVRDFLRSATRPDERDPRVRIEPMESRGTYARS